MEDRKERILLVALNMFGNFTTIHQEFNEDQIGVIYEAMEIYLDEMKDKDTHNKLDEIIHRLKT